MPECRTHRSTRRLLIRRALLLSALSAALFASVPLLFGSAQRAIVVHWAPMADPERLALERQLQLTDATPIGDNAWMYVPADTSEDALRRIVSHTAIARTVGIDRRGLTLTRSTPLTARRGGLIASPPAWASRAVRIGAALTGGLALLLLLAAVALSRRVTTDADDRDLIEALFTNQAGAAGLLPRALRKWLERGVPAATAGAAGLFRIVFGGCVLAYVMYEGINPGLLQSPAAGVAQGPYGTVVRWLATHPAVVQQLDAILVSTGLLFIAGIFTRVTFACFVAAFLMWACIFTLGTTTHAVGTLGMTLICLIPAPWGDRLSIDSWLRARRGDPAFRASGRHYGYAFWIPRLVFGVAFLAAAWSKVRGGPDWILNGTIKYHFLTDFDHALVSWGPLLTQSHGIAVGMSAAAVAVEAIAITAAFSRSDGYRIAVGALCLSLLAGFALFQGVFWWGWWILLLAFLPWQRWSTAPAGAVHAAALRPLQAGIAVLLLLQQIAVSGAQLEARPMLSAYDMYSASYGSVDEYEASTNLVYRVVLLRNGERRELGNCVLEDRAAASVPAAVAGDARTRAYLRDAIAECTDDIAPGTELVLEGDRRVYDWDERRFTWRRAVAVVGPVSAPWLRDEPRAYTD